MRNFSFELRDLSCELEAKSQFEWWPMLDTYIFNYELEEQILIQGERVKVLESEWLREEIKRRLKEALGQY